MRKDEIMETLKSVFGITTEAELIEAIKRAEPLNIGIMTSRMEVANGRDTAVSGTNV